MSQTGIQKTFMAKANEADRRWFHIDADGQILGRLAAKVARVLQGKTKATYTPHADVGDFVVITNAHKVAVSSDKVDTKEYQFFSGYPHGQKRKTMKQMLASRRAEDVIRLAVRRMLPKSRLGKRMILKLKLYREMPKHGYKAQRLEPMPTNAAALAAAGVPRVAAAAS
jgi:large subunit ribosomal protein L13